MSVIGREWSSDVFTFWGLTYLLRDLIGILNPFIFLVFFLAQKSYKIIATKHCAVTLYNYIYTLCVISELFNNHWSWGSEYLSASLKSANSTTLPLSAIPFSDFKTRFSITVAFAVSPFLLSQAQLHRLPTQTWILSNDINKPHSNHNRFFLLRCSFITLIFHQDTAVSEVTFSFISFRFYAIYVCYLTIYPRFFSRCSQCSKQP